MSKKHKPQKLTKSKARRPKKPSEFDHVARKLAQAVAASSFGAWIAGALRKHYDEDPEAQIEELVDRAVKDNLEVHAEVMDGDSCYLLVDKTTDVVISAIRLTPEDIDARLAQVAAKLKENSGNGNDAAPIPFQIPEAASSGNG